MDENKILLPYNFTDMDKKALEFICRTYVNHDDVSVTVFHAYSPVPDIDVSKSSVMEKMSSNLHYLRRQVIDQESRMIEIKQYLLSEGFKDSRVNYLYLPKKKDIAREIIQLARDERYHTIVLSRSGTVTSFFIPSVFNKVVTTLKNVTITIIT
ncbi:universal stress protein [Desulfobacula toluolica]|uniref:UspA domain-containing protein n=1 Tax=Desulfobacula toluolica (strain DSM 7467 / Tol2) TaxID=651182 RepID=K0NFN7_DESTT|nr:universal stress protein [Desulfobacula toluolica]CCK79750.1 uncharacterized protein TOL2_C15870 [Desulfobacula toluolica Tol2]